MAGVAGTDPLLVNAAIYLGRNGCGRSAVQTARPGVGTRLFGGRCRCGAIWLCVARKCGRSAPRFRVRRGFTAICHWAGAATEPSLAIAHRNFRDRRNAGAASADLGLALGAMILGLRFCRRDCRWIGARAVFHRVWRADILRDKGAHCRRLMVIARFQSCFFRTSPLCRYWPLRPFLAGKSGGMTGASDVGVAIGALALHLVCGRALSALSTYFRSDCCARCL